MDQIVSALNAIAHALERIANALDPHVGSAATVEVVNIQAEVHG